MEIEAGVGVGAERASSLQIATKRGTSSTPAAMKRNGGIFGERNRLVLVEVEH